MAARSTPLDHLIAQAALDVSGHVLDAILGGVVLVAIGVGSWFVSQTIAGLRALEVDVATMKAAAAVKADPEVTRYDVELEALRGDVAKNTKEIDTLRTAVHDKNGVIGGSILATAAQLGRAEEILADARQILIDRREDR